MKITLINTGKTEAGFIREGMALYEKRLGHYITFQCTETIIAGSNSKLPEEVLKKKEAEVLLNKIQATDHLVLLDENGKQFKSLEFAGWLNEHLIRGTRHLIFVTGGAFGFHEKMNQRANDKISLSKLTFPHQLVRLIFLEQLYRAFTIIRGEPYHNE